MRRHTLLSRTGGALVVAGLLIGCGDRSPKGNGDEVSFPDTTAQAVWSYMSDNDYSQNWEMWPGKSAFYQGTEPHGALLTTYLNEPALEAVTNKAGTMPNGAVVIKENYKPDSTLAATTIMYKSEGYNPEAGDWFWAKYGPEGGVEASGKVESCIQCHAKAKGNDYLFVGSLEVSMPDTTAEAVWTYLQDSAYSENWEMWPGKTAFYAGTEPHGALLTTYLNQPAYDAVTNSEGTMPTGAIIVKENYKPDSTLDATTIMYKKYGYNPEAGDWYWAKYDPEGGVEASGKAEGCIQCHAEAKDNDYLFTGSLSMESGDNPNLNRGNPNSPKSENDGSSPAAEVGMVGLKFDPEQVTISQGETVKWVNTSQIVHTVTADPEHANDPGSVKLPEGAETFDSGNMAADDTFAHTFEVAGEYRYFCIPHESAGMIGMVTVEPK